MVHCLPRIFVQILKDCFMSRGSNGKKREADRRNRQTRRNRNGSEKKKRSDCREKRKISPCGLCHWDRLPASSDDGRAKVCSPAAYSYLYLETCTALFFFLDDIFDLNLIPNTNVAERWKPTIISRGILCLGIMMCKPDSDSKHIHVCCVDFPRVFCAEKNPNNIFYFHSGQKNIYFFRMIFLQHIYNG